MLPRERYSGQTPGSKLRARNRLVFDSLVLQIRTCFGRSFLLYERKRATDATMAFADSKHVVIPTALSERALSSAREQDGGNLVFVLKRDWSGKPCYTFPQRLPIKLPKNKRRRRDIM